MTKIKNSALTEEPKISGPKVAKAVDVDAATVRRWHREGCPAYEIAAGLVRYKLSEVLAWRAQRPTAKEKRVLAST